jgi:hypothetical protein
MTIIALPLMIIPALGMMNKAAALACACLETAPCSLELLFNHETVFFSYNILV